MDCKTKVTKSCNFRGMLSRFVKHGQWICKSFLLFLWSQLNNILNKIRKVTVILQLSSTFVDSFYPPIRTKFYTYAYISSLKIFLSQCDKACGRNKRILSSLMQLDANKCHRVAFSMYFKSIMLFLLVVNGSKW